MLFIQSAQAQTAANANSGGGIMSFGIIIIMFVVMYFLMIRPQQKKAKEHKNMVAALKKGDEVMINSGLMGKIVAINEHAADLEISKGVTVRVQRQFVAQPLPKGTIKADLNSIAEDSSDK